jgi:hypothetical protein
MLVIVIAIKYEFTIFTSSLLKRKKNIIKASFTKYSREFIIKLYLILCNHVKIDFKNSTIPDKNIKGIASKKSLFSSGLSSISIKKG